MLVEAAVKWEPIPSYANVLPNLDVVHLEDSLDGIQKLSLIVASTWRARRSHQIERGAWRITFTGVYAYRMRPHGYEGNLPLTQGEGGAALWMLFPSNYLVECSAPEGIVQPDEEAVSHFVLLGAELYEVVAAKWESEPMSEEWAHPFERRVPR